MASLKLLLLFKLIVVILNKLGMANAEATLAPSPRVYMYMYMYIAYHHVSDCFSFKVINIVNNIVLLICILYRLYPVHFAVL